MKNQVIRFTADWCEPCKAMAPVVDRMANEMGIPVRVVDQANDVSNETRWYGVRALPTLLLLGEDGSVIDRISGALSETQIREFLEQKA